MILLSMVIILAKLLFFFTNHHFRIHIFYLDTQTKDTKLAPTIFGAQQINSIRNKKENGRFCGRSRDMSLF